MRVIDPTVLIGLTARIEAIRQVVIVRIVVIRQAVIVRMVAIHQVHIIHTLRIAAILIAAILMLVQHYQVLQI